MSTSNSIKQAAEAARNKTSEAVESTKRIAESARTDPMAAKNDFLHTPFMRGALPFINGGLAGMTATAVIQPIDIMKVRIQQTTGSRPSVLKIYKEITAEKGFTALYTGLSAALLRQAVYTTARIGFFDSFMKTLSARSAAQGTKVGFKERAAAGLTAGGLAAMLGNPADLALIRMQSDGKKPLAQRKNYTSVIHALTSISKTEGVTALWAGALPTVVRAMALNFGQLAFFSEAKQQMKQHTSLDPRAQTLAASAVAGFFASFFSLPFDFVKTQLQSQATAGKERKYKGLVDCFVKTAKSDGLLTSYRGFGTYYVRIAPHAMVTLIVADYLGFITK